MTPDLLEFWLDCRSKLAAERETDRAGKPSVRRAHAQMADATTPQTLLEGPYIPPSECVQPNSAEEGSAQHASEKGKRRRKTSVFSMNNRKFCKLIKSLSRDQVRPLYHARRLCACLCPRNGIRANLDDGKATQPFHLPTCSSWSGGVCESARLAHSPPRHVFPPTPNRTGLGGC